MISMICLQMNLKKLQSRVRFVLACNFNILINFIQRLLLQHLRKVNSMTFLKKTKMPLKKKKLLRRLVKHVWNKQEN
jgi:L-cystine uptake protein TcyP (sodium:dicarboxylate symporter family)